VSRTQSSTQQRRSRTRQTSGLQITCESLNYQLRKVTKARGHFPGDDAVVKLLWLAIINIEDKRARERDARRRDTGKRSDQPCRLVEGQRCTGWREALGELAVAYPGRIKVKEGQLPTKPKIFTHLKLQARRELGLAVLLVSCDRGGGVSGRVLAEEKFSVVAAEEEGEAVQVGAEVVEAVGGVADVAAQ
jgi:hypothetical protein